MAEFVKVATRSALKPGQGMRVELNSQEVALFNCDGQFYAIDHVCPHSGGPLSDGYVDGDTVTCPWHGWQFNVKTGVCPFGINQKTFPVKVQGEDILVSADSTVSWESVGDEEETRAIPAVEPKSAPEELKFTRVASVEDIGKGQGKLVEVDGQQVAVFNCDGQFYAIDEICPHMGGPLSEGSVEGDCVICPWHGWEFNVKTGESPTGVNQKTFQVKVEQGAIYVAVLVKS